MTKNQFMHKKNVQNCEKCNFLKGEDPDIPEDPEEALKKNALKLTRIRAIEQVKKMTNLIDEIGETTIMNSVLGETLKTKRQSIYISAK